MFNIYINDILNDIRPVQIPGMEQSLRGLMFADDTVVFAESYSDLSEKLESIRQWMNDNAMEVNPSKCGVMMIMKKLFRKKGAAEQLIISQRTRYNWMISDHLPIEVLINMSQPTQIGSKTLFFDRKKLYEPGIADAIKNHEYKICGVDPIEDVRSSIRP